MKATEDKGARGVVLAVADGEDGQEAQALFKQYGFEFRMTGDLDRRIARQYGIMAWPTTITIDAVGFVQKIRSGASAILDALEDDQAY